MRNVFASTAIPVLRDKRRVTFEREVTHIQHAQTREAMAEFSSAIDGQPVVTKPLPGEPGNSGVMLVSFFVIVLEVTFVLVEWAPGRAHGELSQGACNRTAPLGCQRPTNHARVNGAHYLEEMLNAPMAIAQQSLAFPRAAVQTPSNPECHVVSP
jgi:hypothetical protein